MMKFDADRMIAALPAHMRQADIEAGGAVHALFDIMGGEGDRLARAIATLGESWFIETCPEWAVPYIADLLAVRGLTATAGYSERRWVAQTIGLRRRKGTLGVVSTLTRATTGWPAVPVEMFQRLATTQSLRHLRLDAAAQAQVRAPERMPRHDTAFDRLPHLADMRPIARGQGRYNIPNIGVFAWRQQVYPLAEVEAAPAGPGRFRCDPAGRDLPLFNQLRAVAEGTLASEADLPAPLPRRTLYLELEARRAGMPPPATAWFDADPPVRLWVQPTAAAAFAEVPAAEIMIADLHDRAGPLGWRRPPATLNYPDGAGGSVAKPIRVAIDPERGRIAFPDGVAPHAVRCSHALAFPGDLGGGPYDRSDTLTAMLGGRPVVWQVGVSRRRPPQPGIIFATIAEALAEWNAQPPGTVGVIALLDNDRFAEDLTGPRSIRLPQGSLLAITSADWPPTPRDGGGSDLLPGSLSPRDCRAAIVGNLAIDGLAPATALDPGALLLDGLLIAGALTVTAAGPANLGELLIAHCTLVGPGSVTVAGAHDRLSLTLSDSVCAGVSASDTVVGLDATRSVILGDVVMRGADARCNAVTVTGTTTVRSVAATDSIFARSLAATRKQIGCLRFSLIPPGSAGPRQFRCQPQLAIDMAGAGADVSAITARLGLMFDTLDTGMPGFARLGWRVDPALAAGGEAGGAMGAWAMLEEVQRRANLDIALDEYLGLGLEAGLVPAS